MKTGQRQIITTNRSPLMNYLDYQVTINSRQRQSDNLTYTTAAKLSLTPDEIMRHAVIEAGRAPSGTRALAIILKAAQIRK
jgi:hypothetical protein